MSKRLTCAAATIALLLAALHPAAAKDLELVPGPSVQTDAEKAIVADPAAGIEHGVILIEERDHDQGAPFGTVLSYHMRAKILSNEARELGDVTVDLGPSGKITKWWGRTILPDGKVLELPVGALKEQSLESYRGQYERKAMKGALPGVEPGAVIDFGYVVENRSIHFSPGEIEIQRRWPVREFRYRWEPWGNAGASYLLANEAGLDLAATVEKSAMVNAVLVTGRNIPRAEIEPYMPPRAEVLARAYLFYVFGKQEPQAFWNEFGQSMEKRTRKFNSKAALAEAVAAMKVPEGADLGARLRAAYEWIHANVKVASLRTAEEVDADRADGADDDEKDSAAELLKKKEGYRLQVTRFFVGVARQLGAEAFVVSAPDRSQRYLKPQYYSWGQLEWHVAAVRAPGEGDDKLVYVAPGSGLPYGEVPWWVTAVPSLLSTAEGIRPVQIPASPARRNITRIEGRITFGEDGSTFAAEWKRDGRGAEGYDDWSDLRRAGPADREKKLQRLCGASSTFDVSEAAAPNLDKMGQGFQLTCKGERETSLDDSIDRYSFGIDGPWIDDPPSLQRGKRVHPVVFPYRWISSSVFDVVAPQGFVPGEAPEPIEIKAGASVYTLRVTATEEGFHVERMFIMDTLMVPVAGYGDLCDFFEKVQRGDATSLPFRRTP